MKKEAAKRVDIVSLKMVKDNSVLYQGRRISGPDDAAELLRDFLKDSDRERFIVAFLNTKKEPNAIHTVSIGTVNSSLCHPREVFKAAILSNASSMILSHNHPSSDTTPSEEDKKITERLVEVGRIIGIEVIDHIIIGQDDEYYSFKEEGII